MRKLIMAGVAVAAFSILTPPRPAHALFGAGDIVVCPTCAQLWQQAASYAKQVEEVANQLQELQTTLNMYKSMLTNSLALPMSVWSQVQGDIGQVQNLTNVAGMLTGNSGGIISRLNSLQSAGYQISSAGNSLANLPQQFSMWQNTLGNSSQSLGRTLGLQQSDLNNQAAVQAAIQQHSSSAAGQMQVLQAGVEMAANNGALLQQINQTLIATAQANQINTEVTADRNASEDAAMLRFSTPQPSSSTGWQGF